MPPATNKNAEYQRLWKARNADEVQRQLKERRIQSWKSGEARATKMALEKYGVSRETYNGWRRALNLTPMNENGSHVGIRTESQAARQPAPAPAPARKPLKRSKSTLDLTEEDIVVERRGGKRSLRLSDDKADLSYDQMITRIDSLSGSDALKFDGATSRGHTIAPKSLSDWKRNMTTNMNLLACDKGSVSICFGLDKAQANIDKLKKKNPKQNTLKTMYSAIVSTGQYIPEFKAAIGVQAFDMYKEAMHEASRKATEEHVEKTGEETVPDLDTLKKQWKRSLGTPKPTCRPGQSYGITQ